MGKKMARRKRPESKGIMSSTKVLHGVINLCTFRYRSMQNSNSNTKGTLY